MMSLLQSCYKKYPANSSMNIFSPFTATIAALDKIGRLLKSLPYGLLSGLGVLLLAGSILTAQVVQNRSTALTIMGFGSFFSAAFLSLFLPKMLNSLRDEQELALERQLISLREKEGEQARKIFNAEQELERLRRSNLNIDSIRAIAQMQVLELNLKYTDTCMVNLTQRKAQSWEVWSNDKRDVYFGVVTLPINVQLGIDLENAKAWYDEAGRVVVSLKAVTKGPHLGEPEWFLSEIGKQQIKGDDVLSIRIDPIDHRKGKQRDAQISRLRTEISDRLELERYQKEVLLRAAEILRPLVATAFGKEVVFENVAEKHAIPLLDFLTKVPEATPQLRNPDV